MYVAGRFSAKRKKGNAAAAVGDGPDAKACPVGRPPGPGAVPPAVGGLFWAAAMGPAVATARPSPPRQSSLGGGGDCVWTIGYSGHTPATFVRALKGSGVTRVVDVRSVPLSRKPGFSKRSLSAYLAAAGLGYVHMPELGAPRELLQRKKGGAPFTELARSYRASLAGKGSDLARASALAREHPCALMCLEQDPNDCHRGILAEALARRGFRVVHL